MQSLKPYLNNIIEGDCLQVMRAFPDASIDMVLSDLPYGATQNKWDHLIPLDQLWQIYQRVVKPSGAIVLTASGIFTAKLIMSAIDIFRFKIVWIKSKAGNFLNSKKQPLRKHEDICIFYHKQPVYHHQMSWGRPYDRGSNRRKDFSNNYGKYRDQRRYQFKPQRAPVDVLFIEDAVPDWVYFKNPSSASKTIHPTQKPVALGRYFIRSFSNPGDIVLDNASGSGAFLVAAVEEDRRFIGIEKAGPSSKMRDDYVTPSRKWVESIIHQRQNSPSLFNS